MRSRRFSEKYIEILCDVLGMDEDDPDPEESRWDQTSSVELRTRLRRHFDFYGADARENIAKRSNDQQVSFHFGYSDDPSKTLKYAPLYTDHVVMQDIVYRQVLAAQSDRRMHQNVVSFASEVIRWKELVDAGYVSIVPTPNFWDDDHQAYYRELDVDSNVYISPILAHKSLGCTPLSDSSEVAKRFREFYADDEAREFSRRIQFDADGDTAEADMIDVMPLLFGDGPGRPEFWYDRDASPRDVIELAERNERFKTELNDIIEEIKQSRNVENAEEIAECARENIGRMYNTIQTRREDYKEQRPRALIEGVLGSGSVIIGLTSATASVAQPDQVSLILGALGLGLTLETARRYFSGPEGADAAYVQVFDTFAGSNASRV